MADPSERKRSRGGGRPFKKGQSGNPKGRPKGSLNKATLAAQALFQEEAEALVAKAVEMALQGDRACLRLCIDRLIPARKDLPLPPGFPKIGGSADLPHFFAAVAARFEEGEITPSEAKALKELAESYRKLIEMAELEPRVTELEEMMNERGNDSK
jgi:hypothetical protein